MKSSRLLDLRPTQFVLGMKEVDFKIEKMQQFNAKKLKSYCDEHIIPAVIGPKHELYLIDHHHFARACWELRIDCYSIKILKDLSEKTEKQFWQIMVKNGWTYLFDQFGTGPHSPYALPIDIRCMADDPYRSLVWTLIQDGLIDKHSEPFFEFRWAEYFRLKLKLELHGKSDFKKAIERASKLATSKAAMHLPGYI